jgi:hypothetical protein
VLEVKDWVLRQILAADFNRFIIRVSGKDETRTNPDKQAKGYVDALMERLLDLSDFRSVGGGAAGKLKIPIGRMVVFPHIRRRDFLDREPLPFIIPPERVLFEDDFDPGEDLLTDTSGQMFRKRWTVLPSNLNAHPREINSRTSSGRNLSVPTRLGEENARFKHGSFSPRHPARQARRLGRGQVIKVPERKTLVLAPVLPAPQI